MPYTLVKGSFHIFYPENPASGPEPDGDTIKFKPDDRRLVEALPHTSAVPKFNLAGITTIRFEGIDTLETHFSVEGDIFHQQPTLAVKARDVLLEKMGFGKIEYFTDKPYKVKAVENHPVRGYILSNGVDVHGRVIAFVFVGDNLLTDGTSVFATAEDIDTSLNVYMLRQGQAYGEFYLTLPPELRTYLQDIVHAVRNGQAGLWMQDTVSTAKSAVIPGIAALETLVIWPKLFRRLVSYFQSGYAGLADFNSWLRIDPKDRDDRLLLPTIELGNMHDLFTIDGDRISMKYLPEDVVIVPDDYQLPVPVPTPVPVPSISKGKIRIIAALINPKDRKEVGYETVTILNVTDSDIDITGWKLADGTGDLLLNGVIAKGEARRLTLTGQVRLSNERDTITVLDTSSNIIDQVVYEKRQLPKENYTMVF